MPEVWRGSFHDLSKRYLPEAQVRGPVEAFGEIQARPEFAHNLRSACKCAEVRLGGHSWLVGVRVLTLRWGDTVKVRLIRLLLLFGFCKSASTFFRLLFSKVFCNSCKQALETFCTNRSNCSCTSSSIGCSFRGFTTMNEPGGQRDLCQL